MDKFASYADEGNKLSDVMLMDLNDKYAFNLDAVTLA